MACIVYRTDAGGRTYAYSSESYWDKSKGQPRSKRTYLGRVNPETGEIIKGRQNGKNFKNDKERLEEHLEKVGNTIITELKDELAARKEEIEALKLENSKLSSQVARLTSICQSIARMAAQA